MSEENKVERRVLMGLGQAVLRLIHVEKMYADGVDPGDFLIAERNLIVEALDEQFRLDLGMDCDADGIPDSIDDVVEIRDVGIFKTSAETSCCRIVPEGVKSRTKTVAVGRKKKAPKEAPAPAPAFQAPDIKVPKAKKGFLGGLFGSEDK